MYTDSQLKSTIEDAPHGGGRGYSNEHILTKAEADYVVSNETALRKRLREPETTVFIEGDEEIELTQHCTLARGVTLASDRGRDGSDGALLYTTEEGKDSESGEGILRSQSNDITITGIRLDGPRVDAEFTRWDYDAKQSYGIKVYGDIEIENCHIRGFPFSGVQAGSNRHKPDVHVHHSIIEQSYQIGFGYGVDMNNGYCHIEYVYFNETRHAVDGFGFPSNDMLVEHSIIGPDTYSHAIDMHCLGENYPKTSRHLRMERGVSEDSPWYFYRAGGKITIRYNTFCFSHDVRGRRQEAVAIRGEPAKFVEIYGNRLMHPSPPKKNSGNSSVGNAWRQVNVTTRSSNVPTNEQGWTENFYIGDNQFAAPPTPWREGYGIEFDLDNSPFEALVEQFGFDFPVAFDLYLRLSAVQHNLKALRNTLGKRR